VLEKKLVQFDAVNSKFKARARIWSKRYVLPPLPSGYRRIYFTYEVGGFGFYAKVEPVWRGSEDVTKDKIAVNITSDLKGDENTQEGTVLYFHSERSMHYYGKNILQIDSKHFIYSIL
jgi:hypothetical protein